MATDERHPIDADAEIARYQALMGNALGSEGDGTDFDAAPRGHCFPGNAPTDPDPRILLLERLHAAHLECGDLATCLGREALAGEHWDACRWIIDALSRIEPAR